MGIFDRTHLGRRGLVAVVALALTQYACEPPADTVADSDPVGDEVQADAPPEEQLDDPADAEVEASTTYEVILRYLLNHPGGLAVMGYPEEEFCGANSGAYIAGAIVGSGIGVAGLPVVIQVFHDADGSGTLDPGEETGDPTRTVVESDGLFWAAAPLQQYGDHGVALLQIGDHDLTAEAAAGLGVLPVDDTEGERLTTTFSHDFAGVEAGDPDAFATCP